MEVAEHDDAIGMRETGAEDEWIVLSIFYVRKPRIEGDPPAVRFRGEVLYGEGKAIPAPGRQRLSTEKLGDGIRVLRIWDRFSTVAAMLDQGTFDHQKDRFVFGLARRPPVVGLRHASGTLDGPVSDARRIRQFVRVDKVGLLERLSAGRSAKQTKSDAIGELLADLARVTGCDLRDEHVQWLGDVVLADRVRPPVWWTAWRPADDADWCGLDVHVDPELRGRVRAQVRVTGVDDMCLCDRLVEWDDGASSSRIELQERICLVFLRVWLDSELVLEQQSGMFAYKMRMDMVSAIYGIQDRLTRKLERAVHGGGAQASTLEAARQGQVTGLTTRIGSEAPHEPWAEAGDTAHALIDFVRPSEPAYARFPKGAEGRASAILQFAKLVSHAERAYLVDPWFDLKGAEDLVPRVRGDVKLTILTNLPTAAHAEDVEALRAYLQRASLLGLPPNLELVCLCGSQPTERVFHDRFLLLESEGRWRSFVLTNSFSGLASECSLYVVEAPLRTTALLLEEFERLLGLKTVTFERIWPGERPQEERTSRFSNRFDAEIRLVRALVPGKFKSYQARLRVAAARGFILLTPNGPKWRMTPGAREEFVRWLLCSRERPWRSKKKLRRLGRVHFPRSQAARCPFALGNAVLVLGELAARGGELRAGVVSQRLDLRSAFAIELALRDGFKQDPDPTKLTAGGSRDRLAIRQSLAATWPRKEGIRFGMSLWNASVRFFERRSPWDRCYAYAVLGYLDPDRAVRLCEELLDADFMLALVGHLTRRAEDWHEPLAVALLRSRASTLRGLGAQALAHGSFFGSGGNELAVPADIPLAISKLRVVGVDVGEIALYVGRWGVASQPPTSTGAAFALTQLSREVQPPVIEELAELLMSEEHRARALLEALVPMLASSEEGSAFNLLRALVDKYAKKFLGSLSDDFMFSDIDAPLIPLMAQAVVALANRAETLPSELIRGVAEVANLESTLVPLTPFRWRAGAMGAEVAYGWTILWELVAASSPPNDEGLAAVPADAVERVRDFLASPELGQSGALRKLLSKLIITVPASDI